MSLSATCSSAPGCIIPVSAWSADAVISDCRFAIATFDLCRLKAGERTRQQSRHIDTIDQKKNCYLLCIAPICRPIGSSISIRPSTLRGRPYSVNRAHQPRHGH